MILRTKFNHLFAQKNFRRSVLGVISFTIAPRFAFMSSADTPNSWGVMDTKGFVF